MAEIILLRHGQASFGAENYDQLSPLGYRQSCWLGQHWRPLGWGFDRVIMGTMARHQQTTQGIFEGLLTKNVEVEQHSGLNEYCFQGLLDALKSNFSEQWVASGNPRRDYYHNMGLALDYWMSGVISSDSCDTWPTFCARVITVLTNASTAPAKRTLLVTSGGVIAVIVGHILKLQSDAIRDIALQIKNTSITRLLFRQSQVGIEETRFTLDCFNDVSHLQYPDKSQFITFS